MPVETLAARDLVVALEAVHAGDIFVSDPPTPAMHRHRPELAQPT